MPPQRPSTIVIVPGFNEPSKDMMLLAEGRHGKPGLSHYDFRCITFHNNPGDLMNRIDRFAAFVQKLKTEGKETFPIATLGYSLGGLVVRGFLRKYPERSSDVTHTVMLGTPNWGLTADMMPMLTAFFRLRDKAMKDLDLRSAFMWWLNGTLGHWEGKGKERNWILDSEPWVGPPGASLFSVIGAVPQYRSDNDGIVWKDSATLDQRIPWAEVKDKRANHLNLIGAFNLGTFFIKGFMRNDGVWPRCIEVIAKHIGGDAIVPDMNAPASSRLHNVQPD